MSVILNGKPRNMTDVRIHFLGVEFTGIVSLNYEHTKEKSLSKSLGNAKATGIISGTESASGSFTIKALDFEQITAGAGAGNSLLDIESFNISITHSANRALDVGSVASNRLIRAVSFTSYSESYEVDGEGLVDVNFIAADIVTT